MKQNFLQIFGNLDIFGKESFLEKKYLCNNTKLISNGSFVTINFA